MFLSGTRRREFDFVANADVVSVFLRKRSRETANRRRNVVVPGGRSFYRRAKTFSSGEKKITIKPRPISRFVRGTAVYGDAHDNCGRTRGRFDEMQNRRVYAITVRFENKKSAICSVPHRPYRRERRERVRGRSGEKRKTTVVD